MLNTWNPAELNQKINQLEAKIETQDVIANPTGEATETLTKIGIDGDIYSFTAETTADDVSYDNTSSGLTADDVQDAIDELITVTTNSSQTQTGLTESITANGISVLNLVNLEVDNGAALDITKAPAFSQFVIMVDSTSGDLVRVGVNTSKEIVIRSLTGSTVSSAKLIGQIVII